MRDKRLLRPSVSGRPVRSAAAARASAPGDTLADRVLRFEAYTGMPTYEFGVLAGLIVAVRLWGSWMSRLGRHGRRALDKAPEDWPSRM
jgi:hypothetical protein